MYWVKVWVMYLNFKGVPYLNIANLIIGGTIYCTIVTRALVISLVWNYHVSEVIERIRQ